jgi:hypothetical protein
VNKYEKASYFKRNFYAYPHHVIHGNGSPTKETGPAIFTSSDLEQAYLRGWEAGQKDQSEKLRILLGLTR